MKSSGPQVSLNECQVNDAALALTGYRHLGRASLERLEGDFALVIWDAETTELIGLRDPLGGYPLFWTQHESTFALSTSLRPLCAMLPQCLLGFCQTLLVSMPYRIVREKMPGKAISSVSKRLCP